MQNTFQVAFFVGLRMNLQRRLDSIPLLASPMLHSQNTFGKGKSAIDKGKDKLRDEEKCEKGGT